jgi:predicted AlkP superfamily pyrophosphatase or phosphodiesterase
MRRSPFLAALAALAASLTITVAAPPAQAQAYEAHPKLVVIVVIDQFRADMLERYRSEFQGRGFKLFLNEGAWFPDCYYDYANTKTAPGHATIGTGAYTDGHGIESNEWWDANRGYGHRVSSVEDERYTLVDLPPGTKSLIGASPLNLRASTLGDELRLATQGKAKVFGVSLKDRAAILPPGQAANGAFWLDDASGHFTTSTYYMPHLPAWAAAFNAGDRLAEAAKEAGATGSGNFSAQIELTSAANHYELDFAQSLIAGEKLGQNQVTDLLTISLSAHDLAGHKYGPDSESEHRMVLGLDRDLNRFFAWLDKQVGLNNVWLALTADHGVAPVPATAAALGINSATVDLKSLGDQLNAALGAKFPQAKGNFLLPGSDLPYLTLDRRVFEAAGIDEQTAEDALSAALPQAVANLAPAAPKEPSEKRLPPTPVVVSSYTRLQLERGELPPTEMGRELAHSYSYHGNWYVLLMLAAYQMPDLHSTGTTHFSPWSYDRHVPLAFYGAPFQPGTYRGRVEPVDLAATFASLLGVNQPSASVGHILTGSLKNSPSIIRH